ncbi:MAG: S-layer homology domain-containing protein [Peptococcaceae bacterium]
MEKSAGLSRAVVRYVARTVETVVLNGKEQVSVFAGEVYVTQSGVKSLACLPIGDRPVIELGLKVDGKQTPWRNDSVPVTVSLSYTPTTEELKDPEHITIWYIDGSGNVISVSSGRYDAATGTATFFTTHFSQYAIVFVHKTFDDLDSAVWAKKPIEVMASKGIISGTGKAAFSPAVNITRADYLVLLIKTLGLTAALTMYCRIPTIMKP